MAVCVFLSACGRGESNVVSGTRNAVFHFGNGMEPQGLDPHVVSGVPESRLLRALFEGLTVKNPWTLDPEPGVAERWEVSEDGRKIVFHINRRARWSNGDPITADDYVWSWMRALHPKMGNQYAYMLFPIKNAERFFRGEISDFSAVGVKAPDPLRLVVSLNERTPYFLQLMDHASTYAVHRPTIEKFGKFTDRFTRWTAAENFVGNGPFVLGEWLLNRRIVVRKSDTYWDRDRVRLSQVVFYPTQDSITEERGFRAGQLHYTATVPIQKIHAYKAMENSAFVQAPYLSTLYERFNTLKPPLDDVRVRKALSMAIDRDAFASSVMQGAHIPAYSITPPDTNGYFPPKTFSYDPAAARQLLAEAGYPNGDGWPGVRLTYATSQGARKIAVAQQQMWAEELNIEVSLLNQEWKVFLDTVDEMDFDIALLGWTGDYVDPNNFLDLFLSGGGNNATGFASPHYDKMILREAPQAPNRKARFEVFFQAEKLLMQQMPIIPLSTMTSRHLIHPSVCGVPANILGMVSFKYVWLDSDWDSEGASCVE